MTTNKSNKIEFWREQIAKAEANPPGITAYCTEHGIKMSTYYGWRKFLKDGDGGNKAGPKKVEFQKVNKKNSSFLPVEILSPPTRSENHSAKQSSTLKFEDARWVAEVMVHLIRGLS